MGTFSIKDSKACWQYSSAGVVLTISEPDLTKATVPSFLAAEVKGEERALIEFATVLLLVPFLIVF